VTRPSEITRERILNAAERLFADRGYEETSIRAIVAKARVNQAAINYHFGGKDGLYREVLRSAIRALTERQLAHAEEMKSMSREKALGEFIRHQLHPLAARDEFSRYLRIINWEAVRLPRPYIANSSARKQRLSWGLRLTWYAAFCPKPIRPPSSWRPSG
jgi:AcrR family transcriptional regulator